MSLFIEGAVEPQGAESEYVNIDIGNSHIILLTEPTTDETFILPATPINLQLVPVTLTTVEVPEKTKCKKNNPPPLYTCKTCDYTTSKLLYIERHQQTHWVVKKNDNDLNKNSPIKNDVPEKKESEDSTEYKCPHCSYYTPNIRSLRIHMHIHSHGNAYRCMDCNFRGKNLKELISHHRRSKTISCKYCTFSTHNKEMFKSHKENNHATKWFGCTRCNFAAADRNYLTKHMTDHHSRAMRFDPIPTEPEQDVQPQM